MIPPGRVRRFAVALGLVAFGAAACDDGAPATPVAPPPPEPRPPPVELPADPEALFLVIELGGGFVPIEYSLGQPPVFALSVAGELWSRAPVPEIYPGPLVPRILHSRVAEADFEGVLELLAELRLAELAVGELETIRQPEGGPILADAPPLEVPTPRAAATSSSRRTVRSTTAIHAYASSAAWSGGSTGRWTPPRGNGAGTASRSGSARTPTLTPSFCSSSRGRSRSPLTTRTASSARSSRDRRPRPCSESSSRPITPIAGSAGVLSTSCSRAG